MRRNKKVSKTKIQGKGRIKKLLFVNIPVQNTLPVNFPRSSFNLLR